MFWNKIQIPQNILCVCIAVSKEYKNSSLLWRVCVVEDLFRIQVPVFEGSFDEARHHHKHQDQNIDAGEHLIDQSGLLHPKRQQTCRASTRHIYLLFVWTNRLRYICEIWLSMACLLAGGWWALQTCPDTPLALPGLSYSCVAYRSSLYVSQWAHQRSRSMLEQHWMFLREGTL